MVGGEETNITKPTPKALTTRCGDPYLHFGLVLGHRDEDKFSTQDLSERKLVSNSQYKPRTVPARSTTGLLLHHLAWCYTADDNSSHKVMSPEYNP